jgi:ataxia telangiectasia mutated family protein
MHATREDCEFWLKCALENYAQCLLSGNRYDLVSTFRFVDLWMSNNLSKEVNTYVMSLLKFEESTLFLKKFRPLIYQLSSRLDMKDNLFYKTVYKFIFEMARMFPHDCIWQLLALSNGDRIPQTQRGAERFNVEVTKKEAATKILKQLSHFHGKLIKQMKELSEAYLELSELAIDSESKYITLLGKKLMTPLFRWIFNQVTFTWKDS